MLMQENEKMINRLDWLDRVKGIGILFVVIGHIYVEDSFFSRIVHGLNVPLFFIASGYLCTYKREWERSPKEILLKKIRSILFPYFTYSIAMMLWLLVRLFVFHYGSFYEIMHCLLDIFCLEGISVLWFLSALFIGQLLFLFSMKGKRETATPYGNNQEIQTVVLLLIYIIFAYLISRYIGWAELNPVGVLQKIILKGSRILGRGVMAVAFMLMGAFICLTEKKCKKKFCMPFLFCLSLPLSLLGLWYNGLRDFHYFSFGMFPLYLVNGFLGFISAIFISRLFSKDQILTFFGRNSLIIMGTHLIFLDLINIMALILSNYAGRYLGDEREAKLAILVVAELFLLCWIKPAFIRKSYSGYRKINKNWK